MSGFFSGSEMAFISANRLNLEVESRKDSWTGKAVKHFMRNPETFLTTTLVGNNIANVAFATLASFFLAAPLATAYQGWTGAAPPVASILISQILIAFAVILLLGEILPKVVFRRYAERGMKTIAVAQRTCYYLFRPFHLLANAASTRIIKLVQPDFSVPGAVVSRRDMELVFKELRNSGGEDLDAEDSEILHNVLELSNMQVKESMIPRTDIVAVEKHTSIDETLKLFITSGFSKLLVYRESIDDIIGVIFAYDLFNNPENLTEIMRPVKLVPLSHRSKDLLSEFRRSNLSVGVVSDEYGGTAGMVTIEDLLEEVVGDIQDEYDTEDYFMKKISANTYILSGGIEVEDLLEKYPEIDLPVKAEQYETVAGFVINTLGRIPNVNEELLIEGKKIIISKATSSRIEMLKLVI